MPHNLAEERRREARNRPAAAGIVSRHQRRIGRRAVERGGDRRRPGRGVIGRHQPRRAADELAMRRNVRSHDRHSRGHRLDRRQAEALEPAGTDRDRGLAIGARRPPRRPPSVSTRQATPSAAASDSSAACSGPRPISRT